MQDLAKRGIRGLRLYADKASVKVWPGAPHMETLWKCAAEHNISLCLLANPDALLGIAQMCEAHPDTRVVIDHFARIGMKGASPVDLDRLCRLASFPNTFVKTSAFYALGLKKPPYEDLAPMVRALRDSFGAARLMWGSDCPYQVQGIHSYPASIALIQNRLDFLSTEEKHCILRTTAERVFFS